MKHILPLFTALLPGPLVSLRAVDLKLAWRCR